MEEERRRFFLGRPEGQGVTLGIADFQFGVTGVLPLSWDRDDDDIFILFIPHHRRMEKPGQSKRLCLRAQGIPIPLQGFVLQLLRDFSAPSSPRENHLSLSS